MDPLFALDIALPARDARRTLRELHAQLRAAILDGRLRPGLRLPATRTLASAQSVSRNTVVAAYERLVSEGYAMARQGSGTYVADLRAAAPAAARRPPAPPSGGSDVRLHPFWRERRATAPAPVPPPRFDFSLGLPDHRHFPFDVWRRLETRTIRAAARGALTTYGGAQGQAALRDAIAAHVSRSRALACLPDDIVVTAGAQQAFDLLARILVAPPRRTTVAVEDPGYPPMRTAFEAAGAHIVPVPVRRDGIDVARVPRSAAVICVTPSHQFPLGVVMSTAQRSALLQAARAQAAVIVEDDYDSEYRFDDRPLDALKTLDRDGLVFYIGTFSKCLFPAFRLGYIVAPAWARDALAAAKRNADWHNPLPSQETLAAFIGEGHLVRHLRRMHRVYAARRTRLLDTLVRDFADWLEPIAPAAGLHLAALCRPGVDANAIARKARERGFALQLLRPYCLLPATRQRGGLLFGYGAIDVPAIDAGMRELRRIVASIAA